tara:strand:- start:155 stop:373 length:219 start_codon:yes stop_codon:yes gene_type:complete
VKNAAQLKRILVIVLAAAKQSIRRTLSRQRFVVRQLVDTAGGTTTEWVLAKNIQRVQTQWEVVVMSIRVVVF